MQKEGQGLVNTIFSNILPASYSGNLARHEKNTFSEPSPTLYFHASTSSCSIRKKMLFSHASFLTRFDFVIIHHQIIEINLMNFTQ